MEDIHREILRKGADFLPKNIHNVDAVCDELLVLNVLDEGMVDSIMVKKPAPKGQARELLHILPRRGKRAFQYFKEALIKTNNKDAADFLSEKEGDSGTNNQSLKLGLGNDKPPIEKSSKVQETGNTKISESGYTKKPEAGTTKQPETENTKTAISEQKCNDETWPDLVNGCSNVRKSDIVPSDMKIYTTITCISDKQIYEMACPTGIKGKLIVISNVHCGSCQPDRVQECTKHVDFDNTNIQTFFKSIGYNFYKGLSKNKKKQEVLDFLQERMDEIDNDDKQYNSLVVAVLSGKTTCDSTKIYDCAGEEIPRKDIQDIICKCRKLKGKPKLIIIQTYNFQETQDELDSKPSERADDLRIEGVPNNDDLFVISSVLTTDSGPWMVGKNMNGSYIIQGLLHVMKKFAYNSSLFEILKKLNLLLSKAAVPSNEKETKEGGMEKCKEIDFTRKSVAEVIVLEHSVERELYFFPLLKLPDLSASLGGNQISQPSS